MDNLSGNADWMFAEKKIETVSEKKIMQSSEFEDIMKDLNELSEKMQENLMLLHFKYPNKEVYDSIIHSEALTNNIKKINYDRI